MILPPLRFAVASGLLCCALGRGAQTTPAPVPAAPVKSPPALGGVETPWEARKIVAALAKDNQQLKPVLEQLEPGVWYRDKGAPGVYIQQWNTAKAQVDDIINATARLSQNVESLSQVLDTYFRLEALDVTTRSVDEGALKYDDRGVADRLAELIARNFNSRERFREYLRELATSKEQDFKVADLEAQRCRGMISKELPSKTNKRSRP